MRETILVVDEEPFVLRTVNTVLARGSYCVLQAGSPREALRIAVEVKEPIDLLVCDVIMPDISGPSLAERFVELHPETRCIFMAGMPDSAEIHDRILRLGKSFLAKPFLPGTLLAKVRQVLDQDQARVA
jgi:two-component system, cell cycle sensor histidine kinase and response regulator CckA